MEAAKSYPIYTVIVIVNGQKYDLTPVMVELDIVDAEEQMAKRVNIDLLNVMVGDIWLSTLIKVRSRVFIYADDGERSDEVFRGYVWVRSYKSALEKRTLSLRCYDDLIYFQESEESEFFPAGKSTEDVIQFLAEKWGINIDYQYESITHEKLALRGSLADVIMSDVLDLVADRTFKRYVILFERDVVTIKGLGGNSDVYEIRAQQNALATSSECTMEGMTTQVVIMGKEGEDERAPVEATETGDTERYGTLQRIINRNEEKTLEEAKEEAQGILKRDGKPKWSYEVKAADIPWIRKGDKVHVNAGDIQEQDLLVTSIDRSISPKQGVQMVLTLIKPEED